MYDYLVIMTDNGIFAIFGFVAHRAFLIFILE